MSSGSFFSPLFEKYVSNPIKIGWNVNIKREQIIETFSLPHNKKKTAFENRSIKKNHMIMTSQP